MAGPRTRQKLQPRSEQALVNTFRSHYADRDRVGQPGLLNHRVNKFRDERNVNGDISNRTMHRDFSTFDTQQGNRVNQPGGRASKLLITDNQNSDIDYYLRRIGTGGSGYEQHGVGGEQIPIQLTGGGQDYWHTEDTRNMLTAMNENSNFVQRPEFDMNQPSTWNRGGSVNPHEETKRAAREWSPRMSNQPLSGGRSSGNRTVRRNMHDRSANINRRNNIRNPVVKNNPPSMINSRPETKSWNMFKNFAPTGGNVGRHLGNFLVDQYQLSPALDEGIMSFNDPNVNQMKDDYFGHRLVDTGWGRGLLGHWANKFGDENTLNAFEGLPDLEDKRGWLGADWDLDIGKDNFGVNATWNLQDLFRRG